MERERKLRLRLKQLAAEKRRVDKDNRELREQLEALKAHVALLQGQQYGPSTERVRQDAENSKDTGGKIKRRRGKQPGSAGHGRQTHPELPGEEVVHEVAQEQQACSICGLPFAGTNGTRSSVEIHWEVRLVRRVHRRTRYVKSCSCGPRTVAAPGAAKLIPKGKFSCGFWAHLVVQHFHVQMPVGRIVQLLALEGLALSQGTLTGGLKRLGPLIEPVYSRLLERNRASDHWWMDETSWMVYEAAEGKRSFRWWLWVMVTRETCCYLMDPSRSSAVVKRHLGEDASGIANVDRYSAYKPLLGQLRLAFCWSHVRRDFVRISKSWPNHRAWAELWIARIKELFALAAQRRQATDAAPLTKAIHEALDAMRADCESELADPQLARVRAKALESMKRHWEGLVIFADHPEVPMDNNRAERALRNPVSGRKSYYGNGACWAGHLAAMFFSIIQTLLLHGVSPLAWLTAYFQACAGHGGIAPKEIDIWMPWNLDPQRKQQWSLQPQSLAPSGAIAGERSPPPRSSALANSSPPTHSSREPSCRARCAPCSAGATT